MTPSRLRQVERAFCGARVFCRVAAVLFTAFGVAGLCSGRVPVCLFGAYLVCVSYLVWFRLSPWAIQNTCAILGFFLVATTPTRFMTGSNPPNLLAALGAAFLCLVVVGFAYGPLCRYLIRRVFPNAVVE